jgi:hypothetical protein
MNTDIQPFIDRVRRGEPVEFQDTMAVIEANYRYTPTRFSNGLGPAAVVNEAGKNEGSCKLFSFARLAGLTREETLALFGAYYRDDVLGHPEGSDHQNIRNFIRDGWDGIRFEGDALTPL